jgi:hypothetical protein
MAGEWNTRARLIGITIGDNEYSIHSDLSASMGLRREAFQAG